MTDLDVRDLGGRAARAAVASLVGVAGSVAITLVLPTHMHFSGCLHGEGWLVPGGDPVLMLAGAVAIALGAYAILGAMRRWPPRLALPRATLYRSRSRSPGPTRVARAASNASVILRRSRADPTRG